MADIEVETVERSVEDRLEGLRKILAEAKKHPVHQGFIAKTEAAIRVLEQGGDN